MYLGRKVQVTPNATPTSPGTKAPTSRTTVMQGKGLPTTDLRITCKGQTFYAHKSIVGAASEHMNNMFKREQYSSSSGSDDMYNMVLTTVEPVDVSNILKYMYEDELKIQESQVDGFVSIAKILQVDKMLQYMPRNQTSGTKFQPLSSKEVNIPNSFDSRTGNPILALVMESIPLKKSKKKGKKHKGKPIQTVAPTGFKNEPVAQSSRTYADSLMSNVMRPPAFQQEPWPELAAPSVVINNGDVKGKVALSRKAKKAAKKKSNEAQAVKLLNQLKLSEDLISGKQLSHFRGVGTADGQLSRSQGDLSVVKRKTRGICAADERSKEHLDALMSLPPGVVAVPNIQKKMRSKSFCTAEDSSFDEGDFGKCMFNKSTTTAGGSCGDIHKRDKPDLVVDVGFFKKNVHSRSTRRACLLSRSSECEDSNDPYAFELDVDYDY